ncbi:alpha/beta fold hydrolase [Sphingomonas daechungensis]|uniref:alpha/beta fold hydrolase n=1 Tax=Sphingomonas daechungensis TaxID=1176646 RepID=UPI003783F9C8
MADLQFLDAGDGQRLAYRKRDGRGPTLVFLPGYASDMEGSKAVALDAFAAKQGLDLLRFDYSGTGASEGVFEGGTLARWLDDALLVIDRLTDGPIIVLGSSMGGWIGLHLALRMPTRVTALVGIAAAPDFTEWAFPQHLKDRMSAGETLRRQLPDGSAQVTTAGFWRSGQEMQLLGSELAIDCPVRLIHGDCDDVVPVEIAFRLKDRLRSRDVQVTVIKGGGHRLSEPHEIDAFLRTVGALMERPQ